jgi:tRNA dimethylallyltransferase
MITDGFIDEVKTLRKRYDGNTALQAAGYRQICQYLDGEISLDEAIDKTKQIHRNYAKRQMTWLRKNQDIIWIKNAKDAEKNIESFLKSSDEYARIN